MVRGWKLWTFGGILAAVVLALSVCIPIIHGVSNAQSTAAADPLDRINVVDLALLVSKHPDAPRLQALDNEIAYLQGQEGRGPDGTRITEQAYKELEGVRKRLMGSFEADMVRTQSDLNSKKASVEATLKGEAEQLSREMEAFQKELQSRPEIVQRLSQQKFNAHMQSYLADMILVRDRNLAARRIALQRGVEDRMAAEKRALDAQLADRMDGVLKASQNEKLQIQLDMQTATDEEQRKKLAERLSALNSLEDDKRAELRKELGASYERKREEELASVQGELNAYRKKLDADVRAQLGAEQSKVGGGSKDAQAILQQEVERKQAELKGRFESRKNALMGQLEAESAAAQAFLKSRQKKLENEMELEKKRIVKIVLQGQEKQHTEDKKRREHLRKQLEELKEQRERVYEGIVDQIRDGVANLAKERDVPLVLAGYRVNVTCPDLTAAALERVAKK